MPTTTFSPTPPTPPPPFFPPAVSTSCASYIFSTKRKLRQWCYNYNIHLIYSCRKWNVKYLQHNRHHSQKLSVASELLATVYLLPPGQPVVDTLVIGKWCSLLPMKEVISNLNEEKIKSWCENNKKLMLIAGSYNFAKGR